MHGFITHYANTLVSAFPQRAIAFPRRSVFLLERVWLGFSFDAGIYIHCEVVVYTIMIQYSSCCSYSWRTRRQELLMEWWRTLTFIMAETWAFVDQDRQTVDDVVGHCYNRSPTTLDIYL